MTKKNFVSIIQRTDPNENANHTHAKFTTWRLFHLKIRCQGGGGKFFDNEYVIV